jgi:hypothetical protein
MSGAIRSPIAGPLLRTVPAILQAHSMAIRLHRPIAPAVGLLDGWLELLPGQLRLPLALDLQVVEEFQEYNIEPSS